MPGRLLLLAVLLGIAEGSGLRRTPAIAPPVDEFPELVDVAELALLSRYVYQYEKFHHPDQVCDDWNNQASVHRGVTCHWYRHDLTLGTQVMIVSSCEKDYLAVIFAGTDDLLTTLLDVDVRKVDFGTLKFDDQNKANASKIPVSLDCAECKVHEGFNNAVFCNRIFDEIYVRVEDLRRHFARLFTAGHSLGAANSILTAVGLAVEFEKKQFILPHPVTSINFGGPQVGNKQFREYIHSRFLSHPNSTRSSRFLSIWRFVLGWDLVPRLPDFFEHIGHTVQMHHPECENIITDCYFDDQLLTWVWPNHHENITREALTYYHHYGNESLHYAGVPSNWAAKPYLWVPGALMSHAIIKYADYLQEWSLQSWIRDFVAMGKSNASNPSLVLPDDDTYAEPPDDDLSLGRQGRMWRSVERRLRKWMWQ